MKKKSNTPPTFTSKHPWQYTGDPVAGSRVESWTRTHEDGGSAWFQTVGVVQYDLDGDPFFPFATVEHQQFHALPPKNTEGNRAWRYL